MDMGARQKNPKLQARHRRVAFACFVFVGAMVGASFAAVPLYDLFCRVTGFGGTPRFASTAPAAPIERRMKIRFDANVAPGLPWQFGPEAREVEVKVGETKLVHYAAANNGKNGTVGTATYNVSPPTAGAYFMKMQCFCFTEQTLASGEKMDMPVAFFIDPEIEKDPELKGLNTITLSYTFFPVKKAVEPLAQTGSSKAPM
jgi:cytochrome c oxidase assembly protein subunit 11